jgi:hypothetical protein
MLDVHAGLTRLAHDPVGVFLDDNVLDLRHVMKRQHDELPAVCATSDRGDVHQIAATIGAELVEEDLRCRHRAEQVGLDHAPVLLALV